MAACGTEADRFIAWPVLENGETHGVLVVQQPDRTTATAVDLSADDAVFEANVDGDAVVHLFTYGTLAVPLGDLTPADSGACRSVRVADHRRAFRWSTDDDGFEPAGELEDNLRAFAYEAPCPCVGFTAIEIPMANRAVYDIERADDDTTLFVTSAGLEEVSVSRRSSTVVIPNNATLRSAFVLDDGRTYVGDDFGRLLALTQTSTLVLVSDPGDDTELRYVTGQPGDPLELVTMHDSGFVRVFRNGRFEDVIDDSRVGSSDSNGNLVSIGRGRAIASQSGGSGIHVWDESDRNSPLFVEWDTLFSGPVKRIAWDAEFGFRMSTRSNLVFESNDGLTWSRDEEANVLGAGSVTSFVRFRDVLVEIYDRGVVQVLATDGAYCPPIDLQTRLNVSYAIAYDDAIVVAGSTPEPLDPFALLIVPTE